MIVVVNCYDGKIKELLQAGHYIILLKTILHHYKQLPVFFFLVL
jgi:hypothetical protein